MFKSMIVPVLVTLATIIWLAWLVRAALLAARIYQIEEYEAPRFLQWGRQRAWLWPMATLISSATALIFGLFVLALPVDLRRTDIALGWLIGAILLHTLWKTLPAKKALVYTPRMRRILSAGALLALLVTCGLLILLTLTLSTLMGALIIALSCLFAPVLILLFILGGNMLMTPVEARIRKGFIDRARARLKEYHPSVVGITGSYGKTSTKNIMGQLLAPLKETLPTPKSFNTLMGITRTINEYLEPKHKLFLVEMDAYGQGEIASICDLVQPQMAVVTSVGPQHLERFGAIERIADALYELVASLPEGSPAVIYCGEERTALLADRAKRDGYRVIRYGLASEQKNENFDVIASNITIDERATHFTWSWPAEGLEYQVNIPLLGQHNILNVSAALAVVHLLGLSVEQAAREAIRLEPAPHRLQLMPSKGGITVIDDSYNANPVGVHNGLEVLAQMAGQKKILVTPGMVELGSVEEAENRRFGEHAARVCQDVILVGEQQTQPILAGLQANNFANEHIHIVSTLEEVTATLGKIAKAGDVVLFANDLPDTYLEMK